MRSGWTERPAVEEQALHGRVVDEEEVALAAEVADREPVVLVEVAARGHRRAHEEKAGGLRADDVVEPVAVEAPAVLLGEERDEARDAAGKPDAVDDARVGRVGDDHLVAGIHGAEDGVEKRLHSARSDDDLALGVVAVTAPLGGEVGDRRAQVEVAGEREPAVRLRVVEFRAGDLERLGRKREVGVEVLHAENGAAVASPVSSAAAATRSIPKPRIACIRSARLITNPSLLPVRSRHEANLVGYGASSPNQ